MSRNLGEEIREARIARHLSMGQLASQLGVAAGSVRMWERNHELPPDALRKHLTELLDVDLSDVPAAGDGGPPVTTVEAVESGGTPAGSKPVDAPKAGAAVVTQPPFSDAEVGDATPTASLDVAEPSDEADSGDSEDGEAIPDGLSVELDPTVEAPVSMPDLEAVAAQVEDAGPGPDLGAPAVVEGEDADTAEAPADEPDVDLFEAMVAEVGGDDVDLFAETAVGAAPVATASAVAVEERPVAVDQPAPTERPPYWKDPRQRWRYWLRTLATIIIFVVFAYILLWAFRELQDALGLFLDQFGSIDTETDSAEALRSSRHAA